MKNRHHLMIAALAGLFALAIAGTAEAQLYNWTGFYAGANGGYASGSSNTRSSVVNNGGYFSPSDMLSIDNNWTTTLHPNGFTGGGQAGYNWQTGPWVFGAELDTDGFGTSDRNSKSAPYASRPAISYRVDSNVYTDWLVTLRPRIGWAANNWLFYVTGGLAVTDLHAKWRFIDTNPLGAATEKASASAVMPGSAVGGGIEIGITPRWSLRAEYLHLGFGTISTKSAIQARFDDDGTIRTVTPPTTHSANLNTSIGRVGVNFRF